MNERRREDEMRKTQAEVLSALAARLSQGDVALPADLVARLAEELELRIDDEAITAAWAEQGAEEPTTWRGGAARVSRRARGRDVRDVELLTRAARDLEALEQTARDDVSCEIDALAFDPLPRGVLALHGRKDDHVQLRVGAWLLLYRVQGTLVVVVAVTGGRG